MHKPALLALPLSQATRIQTLGVAPSPVHAGAPLKVAYETNALQGDVWLADSSGKQWSVEPLSPSGVTWLHVPEQTAGRDMHVTVRAIGTGGEAMSSVSVAVLPRTTGADSLSGGASGLATAGSAKISLSKDAVTSGYAFTVRVTGSSGAVKVALTDSGGKTLSESRSASDGVVTMAAPHVRQPTTYYVIATLARGASEMTLVHKISVVPPH